jgi:hypothetical protein
MRRDPKSKAAARTPQRITNCLQAGDKNRAAAGVTLDDGGNQRLSGRIEEEIPHPPRFRARSAIQDY